MTRTQIQQQLQQVFQRHLGVSPKTTRSLVPDTVTAGKLYEAHVLSRVVERLSIDEGYKLTLVGGPKIQLKSGAGGINRNYPRIELQAFRTLRCRVMDGH